MDRPILEIHHQSGPGPALPWLRVYLVKILLLLKLRQGSWSITLVDDPTMVDLHQRMMNLNSTTDVLTFDLRDRHQGGRKTATLDLDTVICVDEAARQAGARGHALREEILLYAIHSLLHVLGFNDDTATRARRMHRREDELLTALGIGPVYSGRGDESPQTGKKPRAATKRGKMHAKPARQRLAAKKAAGRGSAKGKAS